MLRQLLLVSIATAAAAIVGFVTSPAATLAATDCNSVAQDRDAFNPNPNPAPSGTGGTGTR